MITAGPTSGTLGGALRGRRAVLTGGVAAPGSAIARALAAAGCDVAICGPDAEALVGAVAVLGGLGVDVYGRPVSPDDPAAVSSFIGRAADALGGLDALIILPDQSPSTAARAVATAAPWLRVSSTGAIVMIVPGARFARRGITRLADVLAQDLAPSIRCNLVIPPGVAGFGGVFRLPPRRGSCLAIAEAVLTLCDPIGRITGARLLCP